MRTSIDHMLDCRREEDKQEHMGGKRQYNYCMTGRSWGNLLNSLSSHNFHLVNHGTANLDLKIRKKCYISKGIEKSKRAIAEFHEKYAQVLVTSQDAFNKNKSESLECRH